jgi:hypothetical protein
MSFTKNTLGIKTYSSALMPDDKRPLAVAHGIERVLPGLRLAWTVSDDHRLIALPKRDEWLSQSMRNGGFPILCNSDERYPVTVFGFELLPADSTLGAQPQLDVDAEFPWAMEVIAAAENLLEGVAEGAAAFWGHATPFNASAEIAQQTVNPHLPREPPRGLPKLKRSWELRSPEIPHRLGWLNYWSATAARALGFPDPARDAEWLSRARRTPSGGWIVPLTEAPLDLDLPAHLDALLRAYERFPDIGGRASSQQ